MPRNQGTSRKGKPKKHERAAGMGRSLQKSRPKRHTPSASTGGMAMRQGVESINASTTKNEFVDTRASVLDVNDLDDFLIQAEMANREFASEKEQVVVLDSTAQAASTMYIMENESNAVTRTLQGHGPVTSHFAFQELSVPRRPAWDETTTAEELHRREKEAFLDWRRGIAQKEEEIIFKSSSGSISSLGVTPFEKNIEIWRQLWRVLERCSCIVQIVDARNPLFYLSKDLKTYTTKELGKPMLLLINKSDYLSPAQRQAWHEYFSDPEHQWEHVFFSAHEEQQRLDDIAAEAAREEEMREERAYQAQVEASILEEDDEAEDDNGNTNGDDDAEIVQPTRQDAKSPHFDHANVGVKKPLSRMELLEWLQRFSEDNGCSVDPKYDRVPFGMVGFPNVGKSSVINVLMGHAKNAHGVVRVGVASQPGKTKHFQTLLLPDKDDMLLCDCPGLVFPSFVNNTADLIAAGVYPIAQMRDWRPVMELLCRRIPREVLNAQYSLQIPMPTADAMLQASKAGDGKVPAPTAEEFLNSFCEARNMFAASSGVPDYQRASRIIIKEYAVGKLLYCHSPPKFDEDFFQKETLRMALQKTKKLRDKLLSPSADEPMHSQRMGLQGEYPESVVSSESEENTDSLTPECSGSLNSGSSLQRVKEMSAFEDGDENTTNPVQACRKEASRLLGLVGAPPLEWKFYDPKEDKSGPKDNTTSTPHSLKISDAVVQLVLRFLQAHVQLLLTVDQAYYWMKVSASLHWGLGPNSQCVERVERAAIAKEYRESQYEKNLYHIQSSLEPHRRLDPSSVLALSSARRNLAQSLVDQSKSLIETFASIPEGVDEERFSREIQEIVSEFDDQALGLPEVIDLSWIKTSRNHIASLLSFIIDNTCCASVLEVLSKYSDKRGVLTQSMSNAQNAQEHLRSNLLLEKSSSAGSMIEAKCSVEPNDLVVSLMQYREQLEAIGAALWACQQYPQDHQILNQNLNSGSTTQQDFPDSSRMAWWDRVKELSANCKALEQEIEAKLVKGRGDGPLLASSPQEPAVGDMDVAVPESGEYEHVAEGDTAFRSNSPTPPSKTLVFSGSGSVAKKQIVMKSSATGAPSETADAAPIPERDAFAEHLLVRELQNRIKLMVPCEEEEVQNDVAIGEETETGASVCHDAISANDVKFSHKNKPKSAPTATAKEREPATNMFLGSSGLFAELKQSLPQGDVAIGAEMTYGAAEEEEEEENDDDDDDDDDDADELMLEMMMEGSAEATGDGTTKKQKPARKKKWGRKGRKVQNKDPYGMFTSPDDMLGEGGPSQSSGAPVGVTVKGGKHGRKGYTRQSGYGGVRAIS